MSNIRGGRGMRSRVGGSMSGLHTTQPSDGSVISPIMPSTYDASSSVKLNDDASQQRVVIQSSSGVIRYLFIIEN
jgi:hypothetical protein